MAAAISAHLSEFSNHVDISCDARNAFNSYSRKALWKPLHENFPSLYAFAKTVYGKAADIIFFETDAGTTKVPNSVGSRQGCSLGSLLYCIAIHPLLLQLRTEFPELLILAFCDDVHFVGNSIQAVQAYKRYKFLYSELLQGELRDDKGCAYSPSLSAPELKAALLPPEMPVTNDGVRILGAPVGSPSFQNSFSHLIVDEITRDVDVLGRVPSLQTQHLLATKSIVHRINHLLRNIPGGELSIFAEVAAKYDASVLATVRRITRQPEIPSLARRITQLPLREGGLGYPLWSSTADTAFLAAYTNAAETFPLLFPDRPYLWKCVPHPSKIKMAESLSTYASFAARALVRIESKAPGISKLLEPSSTPGEGTRNSRGLQHSMSAYINEFEANDVLSAVKASDCPSHPWRAALFNSNRGDQYCLATIPTDSFTTIENRDFEVIILRRLLLPTYKPVSENFRCARCHRCSTEPMKGCPESMKIVDVFGNHSISCMLDGLRTALWHDPLRRVVRWLARRVGLKAEEEKDNVLLLGPPGLRADVCIESGISEVLASRPHLKITDVRTTDPCDVSNCKKAACVPGAANDAGTRIKEKKWKSFVEAQGDVFWALCAESGGRLNGHFFELVEYLSTFAGSSSAERRAFSVFAFQRIHVASQRGVARLIRAHDPVPEGPCLLPPRGVLELGVLPFHSSHEIKIPRNRGPAPPWQSASSLAFSALKSRAQLAPPIQLELRISPGPENQLQLTPAPLTPLTLALANDSPGVLT